MNRIPLALAIISVCGCDELSTMGSIEPASFSAEQDPQAANATVADIWAALTAVPCWDGQSGSVQQFEFHGQYQFRYNAFETWGGTISLHQVGSYDGHPAVLLSTWSSGVEYLVLVDSSTVAHGWQHDSGQLVTTIYHPTDRCL